MPEDNLAFDLIDKERERKKKMNNQKKYPLWIAFNLLLILSLAAGCSPAGNRPQPDERQTLKILYDQDEQSFYDHYGALYSALNPNLDIKVITTLWIKRLDNEDKENTLKQLIDEKQPDVLILSEKQYEQFSREGRLAELAGMTGQEQFHTESFLPGMLEYLTDKGGGTLYGLAPTSTPMCCSIIRNCSKNMALILRQTTCRGRMYWLLLPAFRPEAHWTSACMDSGAEAK